MTPVSVMCSKPAAVTGKPHIYCLLFHSRHCNDTLKVQYRYSINHSNRTIEVFLSRGECFVIRNQGGLCGVVLCWSASHHWLALRERTTFSQLTGTETYTNGEMKQLTVTELDNWLIKINFIHTMLYTKLRKTILFGTSFQQVKGPPVLSSSLVCRYSTTNSCIKLERIQLA